MSGPERSAEDLSWATGLWSNPVPELRDRGLLVADHERAEAASAAIAREEQVRATERDFWDRGVEHIREGIGPWQPDRDTYQWAVEENRREAEAEVDRMRDRGGQRDRGIER